MILALLHEVIAVRYDFLLRHHHKLVEANHHKLVEVNFQRNANHSYYCKEGFLTNSEKVHQWVAPV